MTMGQVAISHSIWRPALSTADIEASKRAIAQGIDRLRLETGVEAPKRRDVIWWLMRDAAETWRRMPDRERSWHMYRVMWPELARPSEDCRQIEFETSLKLLQDPSLADKGAYRPRFQITDPSAVDRAQIVYKWLTFVRAKNPRRDKLVFIMLAEGRRSRDAAQEMGGNVSDYAVRRVKDKILGQIEKGLQRCIDGWQHCVHT
jgi:hypothetical protein